MTGFINEKGGDLRQVQPPQKQNLTAISITEEQKKAIPVCSVYRFEKIKEFKTKYRLTGREGGEIPNFPSLYQRGKNKGQYYIGFRKMAESNLYLKYKCCIELSGSAMFTGFNPVQCGDGTFRGFGDYRGRCVLIEYTRSEQGLTVYFTSEPKAKAEEIFNSWLNSKKVKVIA